MFTTPHKYPSVHTPLLLFFFTSLHLYISTSPKHTTSIIITSAIRGIPISSPTRDSDPIVIHRNDAAIQRLVNLPSMRSGGLTHTDTITEFVLVLAWRFTPPSLPPSPFPTSRDQHKDTPYAHDGRWRCPCGDCGWWISKADINPPKGTKIITSDTREAEAGADGLTGVRQRSEDRRSHGGWSRPQIMGSSYYMWWLLLNICDHYVWWLLQQMITCDHYIWWLLYMMLRSHYMWWLAQMIEIILRMQQLCDHGALCGERLESLMKLSSIDRVELTPCWRWWVCIHLLVVE